MIANTIHCPECKGILVKELVFAGVIDTERARISWMQRCANCKANVRVDVCPTLKAEGNGQALTIGEPREPRIRTFHA